MKILRLWHHVNDDHRVIADARLYDGSPGLDDHETARARPAHRTVRPEHTHYPHTENPRGSAMRVIVIRAAPYARAHPPSAVAGWKL